MSPKIYNANDVQQPFYGHCISQPVLASTLIQELEDFVAVSFTACMPLLMATTQTIEFRLGRRRQHSCKWCYLHCIHTITIQM